MKTTIKRVKTIKFTDNEVSILKELNILSRRLLYISHRKARLEMDLQEVKKIVLVLFLMVVSSHVVESKACEPAPSPTPSPTETPLLILQLRGN